MEWAPKLVKEFLFSRVLDAIRACTCTRACKIVLIYVCRIRFIHRRPEIPHQVLSIIISMASLCALLFVCLSVYLSICACECFRYKSVPFYIYILICSVQWSSVQLLY